LRRGRDCRPAGARVDPWQFCSGGRSPAIARAVAHARAADRQQNIHTQRLQKTLEGAKINFDRCCLATHDDLHMLKDGTQFQDLGADCFRPPPQGSEGQAPLVSARKPWFRCRDTSCPRGLRSLQCSKSLPPETCVCGTFGSGGEARAQLSFLGSLKRSAHYLRSQF
jgi:hypothetical protein